ncbi:MAG: MFS transporter [Clostridia bacterium]|nr:MFS transporter [Clostridia bacterium]
MKTNKSITALTWLCAAAYFCSYLTRLNYSAVMVEMIASEGFTKSGASIALTGLFITYGVGQVISGFLGDKIKPQLLVFAGLLTSAAMNIAIVFCPNTLWMTAVWCVNGFAQAMMWPPLVCIMSAYMTEDQYKKATVRVTWGSSFGTIAVYLTAPLFISISGWKMVFIASAVMAAFMAFIWLPTYQRLENILCQSKAEEPSGAAPAKADTATVAAKFSAGLCALLAVIMFGIVMQGLLRDGITTWMPSYIEDSFRLGSRVSILTGVILPIFSIISVQAVAVVNRKMIRNELACGAFFFAIGMCALIVLSLTQGGQGSVNVLLSIVAFAIASACMHGVNLVLICMVPKFFQYTGRISLISGVLNACTYVGSALSTYGVALLAENFGWRVTVFIWIGVAAVGTMTCAFTIGSWRRFKKRTNQ